MKTKNSPRILIVDDSSANVELLSQMLNTYKISTAFNGKDALAVIRKEMKPDLILLGISMPVMDGFAVISELKADKTTQNIPVIIITGQGETSEEKKAFNLGAADYITKPYHSTAVRERVKNHLELKHYRDQLEEMVEFRTWELEKTIEAYERFVPKALLSFLNKPDIMSINRGDSILGDFTILFSDVRSFASISADFTPEEVVGFINDYLEIVAPLVRKHHGFVVTYIGDAIMAGFPRAVEDAVYCARDMEAALVSFNSKRKNAGKSTIGVGIGINSGPGMLGIIGEDQRLEGSIMSNATNLAARLESLTKMYGVRVVFSEHSLELIRDRKVFEEEFIFRELDRVRVVGRHDAVTIYELLHPELDRDKISSRPQYADALALYRRAEIAAAHQAFQQIATANPRDGCAQFFVERCERMLVRDEFGAVLEVNLLEGFDGITTLQSK